MTFSPYTIRGRRWRFPLLVPFWRSAKVVFRSVGVYKLGFEATRVDPTKCLTRDMAWASDPAECNKYSFLFYIK